MLKGLLVLECSCPASGPTIHRDLVGIIVIIIIIIILLHDSSANLAFEMHGASADKLHVRAPSFLLLVGLARSKQDPINRGHGAQYLYRPASPVAGGASNYLVYT